MPEINVVERNPCRVVYLDVHELVRRLIMHLGPTLVATLSGVRSRRIPHRWALPGGPLPSPAAYVRLTAAQQVWDLISSAEGDDIARAWLISADTHLDEHAPVLALRAGKIEEVVDAAVAFCR
ncbi:MAG TPA: hypothetical protein VJ777_02555 [Mycobacterium sp.]|nr:hypothetical protein [Mycobacterium sp.]